jgi:ubiquinone/menaquinone biosynthesis C-methylase UbiE
MRNRESSLAHQLLDGLVGIEVGGSSHNSFGITGCLNVDYTDDMYTVFKEEERTTAGFALPVDVVAKGDHLPFPDESVDFVLSSHVLEHFWDPMGTIKEWLRIVRPGGYVFMIVPHKERTFDKERPRTPLDETISKHKGQIPRPPLAITAEFGAHWSVWITQDCVDVCRHLGLNIVAVQDIDDKVGNGFTVVVKKEGELLRNHNGNGILSVGPIDLGCNPTKRPGYLGVAPSALPGVDVVADFDSLPFPDNSVIGIYSNQVFHEIGNVPAVLKEIIRVAKHGADIEIWVPHGRCDVTLRATTKTRFTDITWHDLLAEASGSQGRLIWKQVSYLVTAATEHALQRAEIPIDIATFHFSNVVSEFGVYLSVEKRPTSAASTELKRTYVSERGRVLTV